MWNIKVWWSKRICKACKKFVQEVKWLLLSIHHTVLVQVHPNEKKQQNSLFLWCIWEVKNWVILKIQPNGSEPSRRGMSI